MSISKLSIPIAKILDSVEEGRELCIADAQTLFAAKDIDIPAIIRTANKLRQQVNGDQVGFVVNRNINFTNVCYMGCRFCGFAKRREDKDAERLNLDVIVTRAVEAQNRGATEVCIQGGIHPKMPGTIYRDIILAIKAELPNMHIHAFSPFEIWYGAAKTKMSYEDFINDLKECGLGSMPGTAAEILDTEIRQQLTKDKLSAERWVEIIRAAHKVGVNTTATIMYGHIDGPKHWANHIGLLRDIQKQSSKKQSGKKQVGKFTELVPLSFVHYDSPLYLDNPKKVRPGPTAAEVDKMHAVSRIMLHGWIDNIQTSWTKLGSKRAQELLNGGVNDFGGTLMNESISRSAGSNHGQEVTAFEMVQIIRNAGRTPYQRSTNYEILEVFDNHDPAFQEPLVDRDGFTPIDFLNADTPEFLKEAG